MLGLDDVGVASALMVSEHQLYACMPEQLHAGDQPGMGREGRSGLVGIPRVHFQGLWV